MLKPLKILLAVGIVSQCLWLAACITPTKGPKRKLAAAGPHLPFDAVIIPGIPYNGKGWDSVMKARVLWSYILYRNGYVKNVIYSGSAVYTPYQEGVVMSLYGEKLGIPKAHIFAETQARHSTENVYYSYLLARQQGFKSIALATDPFQSVMLKRFTKKRFATPVYLLPFITDSLRAYNNINPVIDAGSAKTGNWKGIQETESMRARMRGTFGKNIDWTQYEHGRVEAL